VTRQITTVVGHHALQRSEHHGVWPHVKVDGSARHLLIAAIRYLDTLVKLDGRWFFSERRLMVDWTETRVLNAE
jgi:hypothetical protein